MVLIVLTQQSPLRRKILIRRRQRVEYHSWRNSGNFMKTKVNKNNNNYNNSSSPVVSLTVWDGSVVCVCVKYSLIFVCYSSSSSNMNETLFSRDKTHTHTHTNSTTVVHIYTLSYALTHTHTHTHITHVTGTPLTRTPILAQKDLDLYRLYTLVQEYGGMERVTLELKWRSIYLQLGIPLSTNASHALKQAYKK